MKRGDVYEIEEKERGGQWQVTCRCQTINEAKEIIKTLRKLEGGKYDGE